MAANEEDASADVSLETEFPATAASPATKSLVTGGAFVELPLSTNDPNRSSTRSNASSASGRQRSLPKYYPRPRLTPPPRPPRAAFQPIPADATPLSTPERAPVLGLPVSRHAEAPDAVEEEGFMAEKVYKPTTTGAPSSPSFLPGGGGKGDRRTYDAMYDLYRESHGTSDYLRNLRLFAHGFGSPWAWFAFYIIAALPAFVLVVLGSIHMKDCTVEPMIPVYLLITGVAWLLKLSMRIYQTLLQACESPSPNGASSTTSGGGYGMLTRSVLWNATISILALFLFCWLIAGAVWVYRVFRPYDHVDPQHPLFCQAVVYDLGFWTVTLQLVLIGIVFVGTFLVMSALMLRQNREAATREQSLASASIA